MTKFINITNEDDNQDNGFYLITYEYKGEKRTNLIMSVSDDMWQGFGFDIALEKISADRTSARLFGIVTSDLKLHKILRKKGWTLPKVAIEIDNGNCFTSFDPPIEKTCIITTGPEQIHDGVAVFKALPKIVDDEILTHVFDHPTSKKSLNHDYNSEISFEDLGEVTEVKDVEPNED